MSDYLLLRLYGPLASWGEIAVGESRHSAVYPSKSALLGLLAAALGIERADEAAQCALADAYRFGVKLVCAGSPLRDYHTVQAPAQQRKTQYRSRRQELADASRLGTLLTMREYRCDSLAVVAVEALPEAPYDLPALMAALLKPQFNLYLGRKSCPLAVPLQPRIIKQPNLREALDSPQPSLLSLLGAQPDQVWPTYADRKALKPSTLRYYWEEGMQAGMESTLQVMRHDQPLSRRRWQFAPRREWVSLAEECRQ